MNGGEALILVGIVIAITQAIKKLIKVIGVGSIILSVVISVLVVAWHYVSSGTVFEVMTAIILLIEVVIAANGGKLLLKSMKK